MKIESLFILYPNQLFHNFDFAKYSTNIALIEDSLFFGEKRYISNFHQNKIVLHRASMKDYFENFLSKFNSHYYEFHEGGLKKVGEDFSHLRKIFAFYPKDFLKEKRLCLDT
jgi:deoxyribodipyrimidine photolyase-related protein